MKFLLIYICIVISCIIKASVSLNLNNLDEQDCIVYIQWKTPKTSASIAAIPNKIKTVLDVIATEYYDNLEIDIAYTDYYEYTNVDNPDSKDVIKRGFASAKVTDLSIRSAQEREQQKANNKRRFAKRDNMNTNERKRNTIEEMRKQADDISRKIEDNIENLLSAENLDVDATATSTQKRNLLTYRGFQKRPHKMPVQSPSTSSSSPNENELVDGVPLNPPTDSATDTSTIIETPRLKIFIDPDIKFSVNTKAKASFGWNLDRINQANLPLDSSWVLPSAYSSIPGSTAAARAWIYVVDTGILASHQELSPRVTLVHNGFPSQSLSCHKHATHVAGIAAGKDVGVNPRARIFDVRVLDCSGSGTLSTVLQGIMAINNHCTLNGGKNQRSIVINMSIGGGGNPNSGEGLSLGNELEISRQSCDAVIVAAAGNEHSSTCGSLPAAFVNPGQGRVIAVSATAINDAFAGFSNFGTCTIINAPGVNILSATNSGNTMYESLSGTSMASPITAGVASVHAMLRPTNWNLQYPSNLFADVIYAKIQSDATNAITTAPSGTTRRLLRITTTPIEIDPIDTPISPITPGNSDNANSDKLKTIILPVFMILCSILLVA